MTAQRKIQMTVDQFFDWASGQERGRYELVDGRTVAMSPETLRHVKVKHRSTTALEVGIHAAGLDCDVFADGATIVIDENNSREPDAVVMCGSFDPDSLVVEEPLIVLQVVSPTSGKTDYIDKLFDYAKIPSIQHYIIVEPVRRLVTLQSRSADGTKFTTTLLKTGVIDLTPPGFSVTVEDLLGPSMERP